MAVLVSVISANYNFKDADNQMNFCDCTMQHSSVYSIIVLFFIIIKVGLFVFNIVSEKTEAGLHSP